MKRSDTEELLKLLENLHKGGKCVDSSSIKKAYALAALDSSFRNLEGKICLKSLVPLALTALSAGASPENVSKFLDWRDFELLILDYLSLNGYETVRSLRLKSRRFELDVVGFDPVGKYALVIDCKHWSPGYSKASKLREVAKRHREKVELMAKDCNTLRSKYPFLARVRWLIPAVVTLTESLKGYLNGSFIVPVTALRDFIANTHYYVDVLSEFTGRVRNLC